MTRIAINGALGKMGRRILSLAYQSKDFKIAAAFEQANSEFLGKDLGAVLGLGETLKVKLTELSSAALKGNNVLIDFSSPEGAKRSLDAALKSGTALVIGTTGISEEFLAKIREASKNIAILQSPNMSICANFLFELAKLASQRLGSGYDI